MEIRWLGEACLEVKGKKNILIDPNYNIEPEIEPDLILITHEHDDHIDPEKLNNFPEAEIFAPYTVLDKFNILGKTVKGGEEIAKEIQIMKCDCYGSDYSVCYFYNGLLHTADSAQFPDPGSNVEIVFSATFSDFYSDYEASCEKLNPDMVIPYHYDPNDENELEEAEGLMTRLNQKGFNTRMLSPGEKITL